MAQQIDRIYVGIKVLKQSWNISHQAIYQLERNGNIPPRDGDKWLWPDVNWAYIEHKSGGDKTLAEEKLRGEKIKNDKRKIDLDLSRKALGYVTEFETAAFEAAKRTSNALETILRNKALLAAERSQHKVGRIIKAEIDRIRKDLDLPDIATAKKTTAKTSTKKKSKKKSPGKKKSARTR